MRTTPVLGGVLVVALLSGCGEATPTEPAAGSTPMASTADQGAATSDEDAAADATSPDDAGEGPAALEGEEQYLAFLAAALDWSYGLAPGDGTAEVLQNLEGYGSLRWTADDVETVEHVEVIVTHRHVQEEWEWVYVDEAIDVASVTEQGLSARETASFQSLADELVAAIGTTGPASLEYGFKHPGGVSQADFVVATADGNASLHVAVDGAGHIGRIDVDWPET